VTPEAIAAWAPARADFMDLVFDALLPSKVKPGPVEPVALSADERKSQDCRRLPFSVGFII
jgi:hypothetical protein